MAYGRLDVFWPDGLFKTYLLADPTVSIGRSPGNTIPLETDSLSRYHATLVNQSGEVQITDLGSANGTFIDGVRLKKDEPRTLYGGEEILIGELRLIYHFLDETPTRPISVPEETRHIELEEAAFFIDVDEPEQAIPPGAHISARVSITNTGDDPQRFRLEVSGVPKEWARMDRPELEIAPNQTSDVIVNFKPRRRSDSAPGDYSVQITVFPKEHLEHAIRANVLLRVLPFGGFGMALEHNRLKPGESFRLHLHNQGSAPLPINLFARDLDDSLNFTLPSPHLTLAPGQRTVIQGTAKPNKTTFFGDAREHSFDLIARSGDAAAFTIATRGYVDERPALPGWSVFALGGIGLALVAIILIGLLVLLQPAPPLPSITAFQVSDTRIAQGDPLVVSWMVADASEVHLSVNDSEVYTAAHAGSQSVQIDTAALDGSVSVVLVAFNAGRQTEARETVEVYAPVSVDSFTITPERLVLYVAQTVTLDWNAPGATSTQITGLENFTSTPLDTTYGSTASVSVVGIPRAPLTLVLTAQNADTSIQQQLVVEMITPQCTATAGAVSLRASPDLTDQIVATIPDETTVVVDAQDALSQWLRVQLSGGAHGWGERTSFTCADTFSVDDLYKELIVPTARPEFTLVPSLAPSAVATAAPTAAPTGTPPPTGITDGRSRDVERGLTRLIDFSCRGRFETYPYTMYLRRP